MRPKFTQRTAKQHNNLTVERFCLRAQHKNKKKKPPKIISSSPMNSWLLSCRWKCPSAGASCVATGSSSSRSDASLTFRSARTRCHRLSSSGTLDSTRTSSGPLPTSKEKTTWVEADGDTEGLARRVSDVDDRRWKWVKRKIERNRWIPTICFIKQNLRQRLGCLMKQTQFNVFFLKKIHNKSNRQYSPFIKPLQQKINSFASAEPNFNQGNKSSPANQPKPIFVLN